MTIGTDSAGKPIAAKQLRLVEGLVDVDDLGRPVASLPIRYVDAAADGTTEAVQADIVDDVTARPARLVEGTMTTNEIGQVVPVVPVLALTGGVSTPTIQLSASSIAENALSGSTVGVLSVANGSGTYTFTETADPDNKFAVSGSNLNTNAALDYEAATSHSVTIQADNGVDAPISRTFTITVTNVFEAATLAALALDDTSVPEDSAATINITGASTGSTITLLSGSIPAGMALNSGARTITGTPTTQETASFSLRETLADSANSPRDTALSITVATGIGGVAIGEAGSGIYSGLKLTAGDDFDSTPTRWAPVQNPAGKYAHSGVHIGFRQTSTNDSAMYVDPYFRGARSTSTADLGYDRVSTSASVLTLTASAPEAGIVAYLPTVFTGGRGDGSNKPKLLSGSLKTAPSFMLSAKADWAIAAKMRFPAGVAKGYWPSLWTSSFFWPDYGEVDLVEGIKNSTTGANSNSQNIHVSATDGGGNVPQSLGTYALPSAQWVQFVVRKIGTTLNFYDDVATPGTLALRATSSTNIARLRGAHDIRLDLAVSNAWDGTTYDAANWPTGIEFDWWQAWTPVGAGDASALTILTAVNTTPGGSWAATLPAAATVSGGAAGLEQISGAYDNFDTPGYQTRDSTTKLPSSMTVNSVTRAVSGTVPTTEGGRFGIFITYAFDDGTPAKRYLLPFNVAPAVEATLFANQTPETSSAISLSVAQADFHSGNLGPHTYTASSDKAWAVITLAGDSRSFTVTGTASATADVATITINCTNSIGQTTTLTRTITATVASVWAPTDFGANLKAWYDASDNATVTSDAVGTTPAMAGSSTVGYFGDKSGNGNHLTQPTSGNRPSYITDALHSKKAVKFTSASSQYLRKTAASAASVTGNDNGFTVVAAVRRGTPGVGIRLFGAYTTTATSRIYTYLGSGNSVGMQKAVAGAVTTAGGTAGTVASDVWYVVTWVYSGTSLSLFVDGVDAGTVALDTGTFTVDSLSMGGEWDNTTVAWGTFFNGAVGELMLVDETTRTADVQDAESYLAAKWL